MRWQRTGGLLLLAFALAACDTQVEQSGSTAAGETELPAPGTVSYDPDTLAFIRERRPVVFNEREWWPQQQAVYDPLVTPVGSFEGVVLYTPADETLPYEHLFIPLDGGRWMGLLPTSRLPEGVGAEQSGP